MFIKHLTRTGSGRKIAKTEEFDAMPALRNARQEKFAQGRFTGLGVWEAYRAAGYTGKKVSAAVVSQLAQVKERIAELNGGLATAAGYGKDDVVRDLVGIIRARPEEEGPEHHRCEQRPCTGGTYHRFPSKLRALGWLARVKGWYAPVKIEVRHGPDAKMRAYREAAAHRVATPQRVIAFTTFRFS